MIECPSCGMKTIRISTKMTLGPTRSVKCSNCEVSISVPWKSIIYDIICVIIGVWGAVFLKGYDFLIFFIVFFAIIGFITYKYVPLIVKE